MDKEIEKRLDMQDELMLKIHKSVEKTRKYFLWTLIITAVTVVVPLIGLMIAIPWFINTYLSTFNDLGLL